jgi:hypothetical protein
MPTDNAATEYPLDIDHSELGASLTGEMGSNYMKAVAVLAGNPGLTNLGVGNVINRPQGSMGLPCRAARATLGISDTRGAGVVHIADPARYASVCDALCVTPASGAAFTKVHEGSAVVRNVPIKIFPTPAPVAVDPLAEVRAAVANLRKQMKALDIERIHITADDAEITRSVRTTSVIHI